MNIKMDFQGFEPFILSNTFSIPANHNHHVYQHAVDDIKWTETDTHTMSNELKIVGSALSMNQDFWPCSQLPELESVQQL